GIELSLTSTLTIDSAPGRTSRGQTSGVKSDGESVMADRVNVLDDTHISSSPDMYILKNLMCEFVMRADEKITYIMSMRTVGFSNDTVLVMLNFPLYLLIIIALFRKSSRTSQLIYNTVLTQYLTVCFLQLVKWLEIEPKWSWIL